MSSLARYGKQLPGDSEMGDSTVEELDDPYSDGEKEEKHYLTAFEVYSLTRTLMGVVKALRMLAKELGKKMRT